MVRADAETLEPAIPVIAPVPHASLIELLGKVAKHWPESTEPGVNLAWHIDQHGAGIAATFSAHRWDGGVIGRRTFAGEWEASGFVRWRPGEL